MKISICLSLNRHKTSKIFWPHQGKIYSSTCIQESSYKPSPVIHCRYKIKLSPEAPSPHFKSSAELSRNIPMKSLKQIFLKSPETFHRKAFLDHSPCTFPFWMCPSGFWGLWNSPGAAGAACRAPNASGSTEEPQLAGSLAPVLVLSGIPAQGVFIRTANLFRWSWGGFEGDGTFTDQTKLQAKPLMLLWHPQSTTAGPRQSHPIPREVCAWQECQNDAGSWSLS